MANRKVRPIRVEGNIAYVQLTKGHEATINAADVPLVEGFNWCALAGTHSVYARRVDYSEGSPKNIHMHRVIAGTPPGLQADHIDGNGLNNTRANLRNVTNSQNQQNARTRRDNRAGVRGVCWHRATNKWLAQIKLDGRTTHLGLFNCRTAAAIAYAKASAALHKEFGRIA